MRELIQPTVGPGIRIVVADAAEVWPALVDASRLENALLNLCINARDAMPDGGCIIIETFNTRLNEQAARQQGMAKGDYLELRVADTGAGMTPDVVARAFEPFFTTKPIGQGTGLGLSMTYGFVQQSGGQVRIHSAVGQGTAVTLYLPRHHGPVAVEKQALATNQAVRAQQGETVLVVDDEPTVHLLLREALQALGYHVLEATHSAAGLDLLHSQARIDVLVTDIGLPGGMNGYQLAEAALLRRPALKVLFITGYDESVVHCSSALTRSMEVVVKPFSLDEMIARIGRMVAGGTCA
jgi:CheY-like chemotaxis protein/anti-sigma regulatory factor (Ser/Thr protein kinase)